MSAVVSEPMHEPLSWLMLERYALDELSSEERAQVDARLAESSEDRSCLDTILNDLSELPPLPVARATVPQAVHGSLPTPLRPKRSLIYTCGALALAAAVALAFMRTDELPASRRHVSDGVKGGELVLVLHGEESGADSASFAQGERFKLLLTCPSWLSRQLGVVLFQGGRRYAPLPQLKEFACGNHVPWPGAFALDGKEPVDVCVGFGGVHQVEQARSARELEPSVVCKRLTPRDR